MIVDARGGAIAAVKREVALAGEEMEFVDDNREAVPAVAIRLAAREAELPLLQVEAVAAAPLQVDRLVDAVWQDWRNLEHHLLVDSAELRSADP
jgi:hypothetical protein